MQSQARMLMEKSRIIVVDVAKSTQGMHEQLLKVKRLFKITEKPHREVWHPPL